MLAATIAFALLQLCSASIVPRINDPELHSTVAIRSIGTDKLLCVGTTTYAHAGANLSLYVLPIRARGIYLLANLL